MRSEVLKQLMNRVLHELIRACTEITAFVKSLGVVEKLFKGKDLDAHKQDWRNSFVCEFMLLNVLLGHEVHNQLNVRLNHFLHADRISLVVFLLLC